MLVAELTARHQLELVQQEIGPLRPGEIRVRVDAVGICGSDMHSFLEGAIGDSTCRYPMVLGHEPAGTVVETGAGVTGWSAGDRAALEPALYCYHCEFCQSGRHNICANVRFLSNPGTPGFFREYVDLPATNLLRIPAGLSAEAATLVEPLAIAMHSLELARIGIGETAVVFGAGPIGLLTIASLKAAGAGRIWAVEPVAHRREMAKRVGAAEAIDPAAVDPATQILADTGKRGVDCAIDCAARGESVNQAIHAVRNGARVLITGIPSELRVSLEISPMRRKELAIFNVRRSNHEPHAALGLLLERLDLFAPLVTHTRPLDKIEDAFAITERYADGVGKLVVTPGK